MSMPTPQPELHGVAISDTSIRQPVFVTMMMLLLVVIGLLGYRALPVNYLPEFSVATVTVGISYTGADPEIVSDQIAKPVENTLTTITGVTHITSTSSEGSAQITVEFDTSVAPDQALQNVRDKVNALVPRLPSGVNTPTYRQFDPNSSPILQFALASKGKMTPLQFRTYIDDTVEPRLERVNGIGSIDVNGGQQRQINVLLNLQRLIAYHLAPSQISSAISAANSNIGLGTIDTGENSITLRAPTKIKQPSDIANIPIGGTDYTIGDVATVQDGVAQATSYARLDGHDAITLVIRKQSGTNTVQVAEDTKNALAQILKNNADITYIITNDQSTQVRNAVNSSIEEIILAVVAAMLVVLLFFRDIRNTLVTIAGLPVIMICTFGALWALGQTINIFSLLALSLSVGLVIDDAIVVRENIFRHLEHGESPRQAASRGTAQVSLSVLAMTLTIIAVFMPVTLVSGTTGIIFKTFGLTVASAMALSLVEAFTFAPMLSANLFRGKTVRNNQRWTAVQEQMPPTNSLAAELPDEAHAELGWLEHSYERMLRWSLRHRMIPVAIAIAILIISVTFASGFQISFLPAQNSDTFGLGFQSPPGTSLAKTDQLARQAEAIIEADPGVRAVQTNVGGAGSSENGSFTVRVKDTRQTNAIRNRLRPQLSFLPKLTFSTQGFQGGTNTSVTGRNVQVEVQSNRSLEELAPIADQVQQLMQDTPGFIDVGSSYTQGRPEIQFDLNDAKARDLNLTNQGIASSVRALISGDTATTWQQNGDDVDVVVQLPPGQRASINDIRSISIPTSNGTVPLDSVASVHNGTGPTSVRRYDRLNEIVLGANAAPGINQNVLQRQLAAKFQQLNLPDDVSITFGGQTRNQTEGFNALYGAMGLSVLFVYMVLASQFGSFLQPLVIMLAMPFSFLGAFLALRIAGLALDITGLIGLIMLLGLVVKNSILLVDFTNRLRRAGMDKHAALERAGAIRLRPILMTSTAIVAGALPVALGIHFVSSGDGSEFRRGLAIVLIGGMLTSTLLTLVVVPTAYSLLESFTRRASRLFRRRALQPKPVLATVGAGSGDQESGIINQESGTNS